MDRLREPGNFSKAAGSNAETPGHQLQAVQGNSSSMARNSRHGSKRSQLSAFGGARSSRQSGFWYGSPSRATEREEWLRQSAVRQFFGAVTGGGALPPPGVDAKNLPPRPPSNLFFKLIEAPRREPHFDLATP